MLCDMLRQTVLAALTLLAPLTAAQTAAPEAAGRWDGAIATPTQELRIQVDLGRDEQQAWKGTISVPAQNIKAFPLSGITVQGAKVHFAMPRIPGDPFFEGTLAADGKTLTGEWNQGGGAVPASLTRSGAAKFETAKSTAIGPEFAGTWEGTLDANGTMLRLVVKLANQAGGTATGTITSVDQGNAEIPIETITQKGTNLVLELPSIAGTYNGGINPAGTEITGEWTQGGGKLPLTLKRPAAK
jgi:hypothetical protein